LLPACDVGVARAEKCGASGRDSLAGLARPRASSWISRRGPAMTQRPLIHVLVLALAIGLAGAAIGSGVERFRLADRSITVKGVAERPVKADIALWPVRIVASGMELAPTQDKITTDQRAVRRFFAKHGIDSSSVELLSLEVTDKRSNPYEGNPGSARFAISATLVARTEHPEQIQAASQDVGDLVAAGV